MTASATVSTEATEARPARIALPHLGTALRPRAVPLVLIVVTGVACVVPVWFVFARAFDLGWSGMVDLVTADEFADVARNTAVLTVGSVAIATVLGTVLAWFSHCLPPRRRWLGFLPLFPLVMPPLAVITGYTFLLNSRAGLLNGYLRDLPFVQSDVEGPFDVLTMNWIVIISGLIFSAFMFLFVRSSIAQLDQEVIDAASVAGASQLRIFTRIVLPTIRPGLVFGALTVTLLSLGQFTVPLLLGRQKPIDVLTTAMFNNLNEFPADYPTAAAYGLPILVTGILFIVFQRFLLRDSSRFETTGGKGGGRPLTTNGWKAQVFLVVYGLLTVLLPLIALVLVTVQPFWSPHIDTSTFTLQHYRDVLGRADLTEAIRHSVTYALATVVITLPVGYLCATTIHRRREHPIMGALQELVISLPLGIPAVIMGTGFLLTFLRSPVTLYGTPASMVITYCVIMLPFVTRMQLAALTNLGSSLSEAATVHGAGGLRRALRIELPLLRPALGSGAALTIILLCHEFSASVLVRSKDTQVMGTVLYDLWSFGSYAETAVMAVLMCGVTLIGVVVALVVGGANSLGKADGLSV